MNNKEAFIKTLHSTPYVLVSTISLIFGATWFIGVFTNNYQVTLNINYYNEALPEAIIFSLIGAYGLYYTFKNL